MLYHPLAGIGVADFDGCSGQRNDFAGFGVFLFEADEGSKGGVIEDEISNVQSDIDALEMSKQELASFSRMKDVATKKGYDYQPSSAAAAVVGAEE